MDDQGLGATLVVLGVYWAGTNAILSATKLLNEARDRILMGSTQGRCVSVEERRHVLATDWLPLLMMILAVSIVICVALVMLPGLLPRDKASSTFRNICYVAAAVPFCGILTFGWRGWCERALLKRTLGSVDLDTSKALEITRK